MKVTFTWVRIHKDNPVEILHQHSYETGYCGVICRDPKICRALRRCIAESPLEGHSQCKNGEKP